MRIAYVTPHLSTGGLPQYLYKRIECLLTNSPEAQVCVIECENYSDEYVVQKRKIQHLLNAGQTHHEFHTLANQTQLVPKLLDFAPDVIHFEEMVESFLHVHVCKLIYHETPLKNCILVETIHGSTPALERKRVLPDVFQVVSELTKEQLENRFPTPVEVVYYPIEPQPVMDYSSACAKLGVDPDKLHVLNVGLFTPGKNQKAVFELAEYVLTTEWADRFHFHFVGNRAGNFEFYWGSLSCPANCTVWGERHDMDVFYSIARAFYFPSLLELNPLAVIEALSYGIPVLMNRLPSCYKQYEDNRLVTFINSHDIAKSAEALFSLFQKGQEPQRCEFIHLLTYPEHTREKVSMSHCKSIATLTKFGYHPVVNTEYTGPIDAATARFPEWVEQGRLRPAHYGAYLAHRNAIETIAHFGADDFLLIAECDLIAVGSLAKLAKVIEDAKDVFRKNPSVKYISFSDNDGFGEKVNYLTNTAYSYYSLKHQDAAHLYLLCGRHAQWYLEQWAKSPWDSPDLVWNHIFAHDPLSERLTTTERLCWQHVGFSIIDKIERTS